MGYSTTFEGVLTFKNEPTASQLAELKKHLGKDRRDIGYSGDSVYENGKYGRYWYHIDLELMDDFTGIQWNGAEKTYDLEHIVNWLTDKMREKWPEFTLEGKIAAQGEEIDDRWELVMEDGLAIRRELVVVGQRITCPHCEEEFLLEAKGD